MPFSALVANGLVDWPTQLASWSDGSAESAELAIIIFRRFGWYLDGLIVFSLVIGWRHWLTLAPPDRKLFVLQVALCLLVLLGLLGGRRCRRRLRSRNSN